VKSKQCLTSYVLRLTSYCFTKLLPRLLHILRYQLHVRQHRHEVRIAAPPRHDMEMDVLVNAGSGRPSQVRAEVESLRTAHRDKRFDALHGSLHDFDIRFIRDRGEIRRMQIRHNHQMSAVVRIEVHHQEAVLSAPEDEVALVPLFLCDAAEEASLAGLCRLE